MLAGHESMEPERLPQVDRKRMRVLGSCNSFKETKSQKVERCHTRECLKPNIQFCRVEPKNPRNHSKLVSPLRFFCADCIKPCGVVATFGGVPCEFICHGGTTGDTTCSLHCHHKLCGKEGCGLSHTGNGKFCPRCLCKVSGCDQPGPNYCNRHGCCNTGNRVRLGYAGGSRCCNAHCECGRLAMHGVRSSRCSMHACAQCGDELKTEQPVGAAVIKRNSVILSVPSVFGPNEQIRTKEHLTALAALQNTRKLGHGIVMRFCPNCFADYAPPVESVFGCLDN